MIDNQTSSSYEAPVLQMLATKMDTLCEASTGIVLDDNVGIDPEEEF